MDNKVKEEYLCNWGHGLLEKDGVWYDSDYEIKLYDAVKNGDIEGASEALKDPELMKKIFGEDAEEVKVLKVDINMGRNGMLCEKKGENELYFISPYVYDNEWQWDDLFCGWVVIPTAP
jgi:hypothetical protein